MPLAGASQRPVTLAGLWGSIRHHGLMGNMVIVSDDAGQFRVGNHALWLGPRRTPSAPVTQFSYHRSKRYL